MCPPRYGFSPNIPHVSMWGMPVFAPPNGGYIAPAVRGVFADGGMVDESHVNIPNGILKKDDPDRVLVRLMPGELVVPKKHVSLVSGFLKKNGIKLSGMK